MAFNGVRSSCATTDASSPTIASRSSAESLRGLYLNAPDGAMVPVGELEKRNCGEDCLVSPLGGIDDRPAFAPLYYCQKVFKRFLFRILRS